MSTEDLEALVGRLSEALQDECDLEAEAAWNTGAATDREHIAYMLGVSAGGETLLNALFRRLGPEFERLCVDHAKQVEL